MPDKLTLEFPSQGWEQFLTARREMLDAFDRARARARAHKVKTFHGRTAEAELRKWLVSFLPKRYGVTAGYVVSPGLTSSRETPHFDVIIYDQIESPILWVEDSPDTSTQGRSLAIPVDYVHCILEVKSDFSPTTVGHAIEHLNDLQVLMTGSDEPQDRYKLHLPSTFCCGLVFFDLKQKHQFSEVAMSKLIDGKNLRGFFGGVILRGEGHMIDLTGKLSLVRSKTPFESIIGKHKASLLNLGLTKSVLLPDNSHHGASLMWAEANFSGFGFDLIAMMQGTYEVGRSSSWQAIGRSGQDPPHS